MKKRYLLMGITAILVATTIVGGSLAATSATGETASNTLAAPALEVGLSGNTQKMMTLTGTAQDVMPGDELKGSFTVKNNASVSQFVRVTVTKYWGTADAKNYTDDTSDLALVWSNNSWLQADNPFAGDANVSQEQSVYYYSQVLDSGGSTPVSFAIDVANTLGNQYQNVGVSVDIAVDAVQYVTGDDALNADGILSAWGVTAQVSGRKISSVA